MYILDIMNKCGGLTVFFFTISYMIQKSPLGNLNQDATLKLNYGRNITMDVANIDNYVA